MCSAFEPYESYKVCELVRQLGALYDKEKKKDRGDIAIKQECRRISAQLMMISAGYESTRMRPRLGLTGNHSCGTNNISW
ncbi:MAG: hypothetical protein AAB975_02025 [Patescibacteria group bacterium]